MLQGSSQTVRAGGQGPKFVTVVGLGPAAKLAVTSGWGASPFQTFGAAIASAAKASKAKSVAVALVGADLDAGGARLLHTTPSWPAHVLCTLLLAACTYSSWHDASFAQVAHGVAPLPARPCTPCRHGCRRCRQGRKRPAQRRL